MLVYRLRPIPPDRDPQMREMIGLAKGCICDGVLNDVEANSWERELEHLIEERKILTKKIAHKRQEITWFRTRLKRQNDS